MIKLLIIADDFTGSLDTGVQFAKEGIQTRVTMDFNEEFQKESKEDTVVVVNAETRPLTPSQAYDRVYSIVNSAVKARIDFIFKKTDSALRGNIGCELSALLDAGQKAFLPFIPAFPKMGRVTRKGIHYIDGIPVNESVFGKDPFEPVAYADIKKIIASQSDVKVLSLPQDQAEYEKASLGDENYIAVYDANSDEEMYEIGRKLKDKSQLGLIAGCAGFASQLPKLLELTGEQKRSSSKVQHLLVISGSLNPITEKQIQHAEEHDFHRISLEVEAMMKEKYWDTVEGKAQIESIIAASRENSHLIVDTFYQKKEKDVRKEPSEFSREDIRFQVAGLLGKMAELLLEAKIAKTHAVVITGGDTVMGFMKRQHCKELTPVCEIGQGAVLFLLDWNGESVQVISKSGGFGEKDIFVTIANQLIEK